MKNLLLVSALIISVSFASCKKEELPKPCKPVTTLPFPKDKLIM